MQRPEHWALPPTDAPHSPGMALSAKLVATASPAGSSGLAEQRPLAPWNPTAVLPALRDRKLEKRMFWAKTPG